MKPQIVTLKTYIKVYVVGHQPHRPHANKQLRHLMLNEATGDRRAEFFKAELRREKKPQRALSAQRSATDMVVRHMQFYITSWSSCSLSLSLSLCVQQWEMRNSNLRKGETLSSGWYCSTLRIALSGVNTNTQAYDPAPATHTAVRTYCNMQQGRSSNCAML